MSEPAIRVSGLGKKYRILHGQQRGSYRTLRETLVDTVKAPFRKRVAHEDFWALSNVSFDVQPGEVVGIIGRNGAGKSTLLKILSRITKPTTGKVELNGRVGSLLEVGTGFHPELTGRENVYLNGSILGMSRAEVRKKFDEIVAFAEVEKFLDTPVKRYSSGMYVRLAFAVAAHLEPEILIVDEVLAVGDAGFQKKCLGRIKEVSQAGRTVLFVSHNMTAVSALCSRSLVLSCGVVIADGIPSSTIHRYFNDYVAGSSAEYDLSSVPRHSGKIPIFQSLRIRTATGDVSSQIPCGHPLAFEIDCKLPHWFAEPQVGIGIDDRMGQRVCSLGTFLSTTPLPSSEGGVRVRCQIGELAIAPGRYTLSLSVGNLQNPHLDQIEHYVSFNVVDGDFYGNGRNPIEGLGVVLVRSQWSITPSSQI